MRDEGQKVVKAPFAVVACDFCWLAVFVLAVSKSSLVGVLFFCSSSEKREHKTLATTDDTQSRIEYNEYIMSQ